MTGRRWTAVLAVVALASAVVAGAAWQRHATLAAAAERQAEAREVAQGFVTTLLTWDHADLASSRDALAGLMTDAFASTYTGALGDGLDEEITASEASATAEVRQVLLGDTSRDRATAVVVVDTRVRSSDGVRERTGAHLELALVREAAGWQVDGLADLGDGAPPDAGAEP